MLKDLVQDLVKEKPVNFKKLGIDEIAVVKGPKNYYVVLVDIETSKIVGMVEKRTRKKNRRKDFRILKSLGRRGLRANKRNKYRPLEIL